MRCCLHIAGNVGRKQPRDNRVSLSRVCLDERAETATRRRDARSVTSLRLCGIILKNVVSNSGAFLAARKSRCTKANGYLNIVPRLRGKAGRNAIACTSFIFQPHTTRVTLEINRCKERERGRNRSWILLHKCVNQRCSNFF